MTEVNWFLDSLESPAAGYRLMLFLDNLDELSWYKGVLLRSLSEFKSSLWGLILVLGTIIQLRNL